MAITKILYISESDAIQGIRLKNSLNYITAPVKTQGGRFVSAVNCRLPHAYEDMMATKEDFSKKDKRQGYHIIISFEEGEATPEQAFEIIGRFVDEYFKNRYEVVYAVHDDTSHVHGHIVFNSVSFVDGKKYRYEKGDWARTMQPITNRLCKEYGFSTIKIDEDAITNDNTGRKWNQYRDDRFIWNDMIRRDLDTAILLANDYDGFLNILQERGYEIKQNKYLAIRPKGMKRFRRCHTIGKEYSEDRIRERIESEQLSVGSVNHTLPEIVKVKIPYHLRKAKLSGMQKKYFKRLYQTGKLKKRAFSKAWMYREDIQRFHVLQEQYLFLSDYGVQTPDQLRAVYDKLSKEKKDIASKRTKLYKERASFKPLFDLVDKVQSLSNAHEAYVKGDDFFSDENQLYEKMLEQIKTSGYTLEELEGLKNHYETSIREAVDRSRENAKSIRTAEGLIAELHQSSILDRDLDKEIQESLTKAGTAPVKESTHTEPESKNSDIEKETINNALGHEAGKERDYGRRNQR